ncbi:class I SAM-dependent methyltransferase [Rhizobacter sp. OV335]|uniref:class I SAM-dependent methyltransferase n=1 Tax=Rhizobacter sp. OV335 TaxID=1500264 RepID=UPI00090F7E4F|nr:class I SAM-dependent methyltransferase [Rhizobacter sp. OV335]SHM24249.1 Methyltransferase domain-containing protein [Rhizobacter sp. OV335]
MTSSFYDHLAPHYHLLYGDWESAIRRQGQALATLLAEEGVQPGDPVLDAACGIGTQTLGLLAHGHRVVASDISPAAVERLKAELQRRSLNALAGVDDLRTLAHVTTGSMAAVLACDNSVPHLLTDDDLLACFRQAHRCLRPGGSLVISVRDYAAVVRKTPDVHPYGMHKHADGHRFIAVQVWEWDGEHYDLRMYLTTEAPDGTCTTRVATSRYYAVSIERLTALMHEAGFAQVQRRDDVLFQPVLIGRTRKAAAP